MGKKRVRWIVYKKIDLDIFYLLHVDISEMSGMTINKMYIITIDGIRRIVYDGICGDIPTKWITQGEWDYQISVRFDKKINELVYTDSNKKEILVFEEGEEEYNIY